MRPTESKRHKAAFIKGYDAGYARAQRDARLAVKEEWRCAACDTPTRFYKNGICPVCEKINDLLDVVARFPGGSQGEIRRAAWEISREAWRCATGEEKSP